MAPLGELVRTYGGGTPKKSNPDYFGGSIPWVTPKDMKARTVLGSEVTLTAAGLENSSARLVPANSVLLVTRSGVLKHTLPVGVSQVPVAMNQTMKALVPLDPLDAGYLAHLLAAWAPRILRWVRATTADNFPITRLQQLEVPLPPLDEQRRIARVLDGADALRAKRGAAISTLEDLGESCFVDVFGDPQTGNGRWRIGRIGDLLESATYGTSAKAGPTGDIPVLRMGNLTASGRIDLTDLKYLDMTPRELERYSIRPGDILFNRTNSADLVGKTALYRNTERVTFAGYLVRLRVTSEHRPEYLAAFLNTAYAKQRLRGMCKSIVGMANINAKELQHVPIPLPPVTLQQTFAGAIAHLEIMREKAQAHLDHLDVLFASLQHRAFAGEL